LGGVSFILRSELGCFKGIEVRKSAARSFLSSSLSSFAAVAFVLNYRFRQRRYTNNTVLSIRPDNPKNAELPILSIQGKSHLSGIETRAQQRRTRCERDWNMGLMSRHREIAMFVNLG
jgi:hypothetical protein